MTSLLMDIRYAVRWLAKRPMYSFVFILSLSMGMSLNTLLYSSYYITFIKKLSGEVEKQADLVWLLTRDNNSRELQDGILYRDYLEFSESNTVFSDITVFVPSLKRALIQSDDVTAEAMTRHVSGNYFVALGVKPFIGRGFSLNDEREERDYALITYRFWQARFGGEPSVIGKQAFIDNIPHTIIGVLPKGFEDAAPRSKTDAYVMLAKLMKRKDPFALGATIITDTEKVKLPALARLNRGVNLSQARAEMDVRARQLADAYPDTNMGLGVYIAPVSEGNPASRAPTVNDKRILVVAFVLIMLIPCLNVASLLLNRAVERAHEFAIRSALGAARMRIVRQLLTELLILNLLGGGLAILVFSWVVHIWTTVFPSVGMPLSIEWKAVGYAIGLCILISMLFGVLPILHVIRADLASRLKSQEPAKGHGAGMILVCAELAISLAIMVFVAPTITHRDKFQSELRDRRILLADFDPMLHGYDYMKAHQAISEILSGVKSIPGVRNASFAYPIPYVSSSEFRPFFHDDGSSTIVNHIRINAGYFDTLNIPIIRGRDLSPHDYRIISYDYLKKLSEENLHEVIINRSMAEKFWPGEDVLGKQIFNENKSGYSTIVGVVADSDLVGADSAKKPMIFSMSFPQVSKESFLISFANNEDEIKSLILRKIREIDPQLAALANVRSLEQQYVDSRRPEKILLNILFCLGIVVFIVAATGIYAVISYTVNRRMREIGIRMMVGATTGDIVRLLIRGGVKIIVFGVAVGTFLAWIIATLFAAKGVMPILRAPGVFDYVCAGVILGIIMIMACCLPIIKAIRSEPVNLVKE